MQCLYASRPLVNTYLNLQNDRWVNTPCNRRLRDYFLAYREGTEPFNPLPFVEEALVIEHKNFDYLQDRDPSEAIRQIFRSLYFGQCQVAREITRAPETAGVLESETMFGKQVTAIIYSSRLHSVLIG